MGKHSLRSDMTCLNCGHVVEKRFCPNCGQENKETKESFHYLFFHTIEDLVHYDSGFWKTIKYLLFHPARLTKEYLLGKRKSFVPPVKLYIFISFLTFFMLALLPNTKLENGDIIRLRETNEKEQKTIPLDSIKESIGYNSVEEYDSIQNALPESKRETGIQKYLERKLIEKTSLFKSGKEFGEKFLKEAFKNIPKALFLIMPIFAFVIWFLHSKKRWYYFDHGVFTLHFFSMMLLSLTIVNLLTFILDYFKLESLSNLATFLLSCWWIFYFYRSHSRMYQESKFISRIKASLILFINTILISIILVFMLFYVALNVN